MQLRLRGLCGVQAALVDSSAICLHDAVVVGNAERMWDMGPKTQDRARRIRRIGHQDGKGGALPGLTSNNQCVAVRISDTWVGVMMPTIMRRFDALEAEVARLRDSQRDAHHVQL
jgi:hypothetical protein